jgi:putative zinc finger protein
VNCRDAQACLPGYLDGAIRSRERAMLRAHLESCTDCREQLSHYRLLATHLANVAPLEPPAELVAQIRSRVSQERSRWAFAIRLWSRALLTSQNILEPLAVPATGGVLTAIAVFLLVVQSMLVGMPIGPMQADDLPLNLVQPAQLESLAPFPVPASGVADGNLEATPLLIEATLNAQGEVVFYKILSGPSDTASQRQIDQVLLFSRFRPQLGFGRPMGGGRVLLSFSEVRVRG